MDVKDPPEGAALAAKLRLELGPSPEPPACRETVGVEDGDTARTGGLDDRLGRLQARLGLSHLNRWVLLGVAIVVAATGLFVTILAWPSAEPVATAAAEPSEAEAPPETIVVSVAGAVNDPGIVEVEAGARVADAIEAAGGLTDDADPGFLNLARVVADGDLVAIPDAAEPTVGDGGGSAANGAPDLVNINVAAVTELDSLTGVGPVIAERIIAHREANGSFKNVDELGDVQGIGPKLLEELREQVTL